MLSATLLLVAGLAVDAPRDTVSRAAIAREVASLVVIDTMTGPDERPARVVGIDIETLRGTPLLAPFLRAHGRIVGYLASHTPGAHARLVGEHDDPRAVRDSVITALRDNKEFNDRFHTMLAAYWRPSGRTIEGFVPSRHSSLAPATLQRVGARFFYPDRVSATGDTLFTHVCAGVNGLSELPERPDPLVEAFVFVAVNSAFMAPRSSLMKAYEVAATRMKNASASTDPAKRILRAQGAMWAQMEQSPAMADAIRTAYRRHGRVMPFRLVSTAP